MIAYPKSEAEQLDLFCARSGPIAPRDAQDLMSWPFFSLAKSRRTRPIDFRMGSVSITVEAVPEHGMATIWDADILIWAASQIVAARDRGLQTSRLMAATPYEILAFTGRRDSMRDYDRLKAALDRLQSTTVATTIRQPSERRHSLIILSVRQASPIAPSATADRQYLRRARSVLAMTYPKNACAPFVISHRVARYSTFAVRSTP